MTGDVSTTLEDWYMTEITITLPLPPRELSPNSRCHWAKKAKAVAAYREQAKVAGWRIPASERPAWDIAEARTVFYVPDARRRDRDNLLASMKAAFDGIADAGLIANDYGLRLEGVGVEIDRANPRVEVTLRAA